MFPVAIGLLIEGWWPSYAHDRWGFVPFFWRFATGVFVVCIAGICVFADRRTSVPVAAAILLGYALPWTQTRLTADTFNGQPYSYTGPGLLAYALVAAAAIALVVWGVHTVSRALVNYGTAAFACSVMWFYFSDVMGKLDRSLGLILLGVLFLAGGWALERTRRKLVGGMEGRPA